jgi:DNA-binding MarR family transcriptional regulator
MDYEQAFALNRAIRTIGMRHRALAAAELSQVGLSVGQENLIMELAKRGPRTQVQLATAAGCEAPTITSAVQRLEALGLVTRRPSTEDRRATVVQLTAKGEGLLAALSTAWMHLAETTVAGLSHTGVDELIEALSDLAGSLQIAASDPNAPRTITPERGTRDSTPGRQYP